MSSKCPKISILTPSYNHQKYVKYFIESVLNQTEQDFELIIVDDNSTDNNVKEIEKFNDSRIKLIKHEYNQGINAGLNDAFAVANGEYCVFIASDDILEPNHLENSTKFLDKNRDINAFYCNLTPIDDDGNVINNLDFSYIHNKSRLEFLKWEFLEGNIISSPGMVVRTEIFKKFFPLDVSLVQFQDYYIHVKLLLLGEIYVTEEKLVRYRHIAGDKNISARTYSVKKRENLEEDAIMDAYLQINNVEFFKKIFVDEIKKIGEPTKETIPYFLGRLALISRNPCKKAWGYHTIMSFISSKNNFDLLHRLYNFTFKEYLSFSSYFCNNSHEIEIRFKKYKKLFNILLVISTILLSLVILLFICIGFIK